MTTPIICATCRRALNIHTSETGVTYLHTGADPDDHPVLPVPAPPGWVGGRCDFCSAEPPMFELPARDFRAPRIDNHMSGGAWTACQPCGLLIETNRWNELHRRTVAAFHHRHGVPLGPDEQAALRALYRRLRRNVTGALRPIKEGKE